MSFSPTWLYIKKHNSTGLLYFGKTTHDPMKYKGSGVYWRNHIREHGNAVTTIWCELFTELEMLVEFAEFFSEVNDIVGSKNIDGKKVWANAVIENGLDGGQNVGMPSPFKGIKTGRPSVWKGKKRPEHSSIMSGRKYSLIHSTNISESLKKYSRTEEHSNNISKAKKGIKLKNPRICNEYECPHCGKIGKGPNMKRYHFNNCKQRKING